MNQIISVKITICGTVQGVGFRPFVYRAALAHAVTGSVSNGTGGVTVCAHGNKTDIDGFIDTIRSLAPVLARINKIDIEEFFPADVPAEFCIVASENDGPLCIDITADTGLCDSCRAELFDPADRRYRHSFINCTDCGPRYTIIRELPYDRCSTTMAQFPLCDDCKKEYEDPTNRRYHAQPICCNFCGPTLSLLDSQGFPIAGRDPILQTADLLLKGNIVAIKGIGGFHLACRADNDEAVQRLRWKKHREEKPFALMAGSAKQAQSLADISADELRLLQSRENPIVILRKKPGPLSISNAVAPNMTTLGIMLPYTPIHHLLFASGGGIDVPLVMTSANSSERPICFDNSDALASLSGIADAFLTHDRDIYIRNDDSIVRTIGDAPMMLRRSRGFVPQALPSPIPVDSLVALGGVLKSTIAVGRGANCYCSQYLGTVETLEDLDAMDRTVRHLTHALNVLPKAFICDMHPQSLVLSYANQQGVPVATVQHHHAHAAACMAENEIPDNALCIVFDGTGYGDDGTIWGSEFLHASYASYTRLGHMSYLSLPGGDEAIKNPGRIAVAGLAPILGKDIFQTMPWMPDGEKQAVLDLCASKTNSPQSCGMGRLFDAVSALLGICTYRNYEGQPAILLEGIADEHESGAYGSPLGFDENGISIDAQAMLGEIWYDLKDKVAIPIIAARFHTTLAQATAAAATICAQQCRNNYVCLCGGVFQNAMLVSRLVPLLRQSGLIPVLHRRMPPNDESISYGQLVVAAAKNVISQKT